MSRADKFGEILCEYQERASSPSSESITVAEPWEALDEMFGRERLQKEDPELKQIWSRVYSAVIDCECKNIEKDGLEYVSMYLDDFYSSVKRMLADDEDMHAWCRFETLVKDLAELGYTKYLQTGNEEDKP